MKALEEASKVIKGLVDGSVRLSRVVYLPLAHISDRLNLTKLFLTPLKALLSMVLRRMSQQQDAR